MVLRNPKRLVIDASIASASGGRDAVYPTAINCRTFLEEIMKLCHSIVMTRGIHREWLAHSSRFALRWLTQMQSRSKRHLHNVVEHIDMRRRIINVARDNGSRKAMLKDAKLIEAALVTDMTVASLDDAARRHYRRASNRVHVLANVVWVNPDNPDEASIIWLREGAKPEPKRMLGYVPPLN